MWRNNTGDNNKMEKERPLDKKLWRGDKAICGTLCICQGLAVLSAVSIIYLSVIIYLPSKNCRVSSCTEWCLGKGGGPCDQIYVQVRQNGTNAVFQGCSSLSTKECPVMEEDVQLKNCKKDNQCTQLNGLFICSEGICTDISEVYECNWPEGSEEPALNCYYKRNCVTLDGEYICRDAQCSRLKEGWTCKRKCEDIQVKDANVLIMAGDYIVSGYCSNVIDAQTQAVIWRSDAYNNSVLFSSCTKVHLHQDEDSFLASDCINGTLMPNTVYGEITNLTTLKGIQKEYGSTTRYDHNNEKEGGVARKTYFPFDHDITIYDRSLLYINHEGCVNTLSYECSSFYRDMGKDGRNMTSPSRFPCYYAALPSVVFLVSCSILFLCSRVVKVTRLDDIKYYTSLFLGTLCIVCVFGFLFLVPFVLDPAISTLMHDFVESPVHCRVTNYELRYGKSNCSWASCREGCTASIYKCHQIRVVYTPEIGYKEDMNANMFDQNKWADLSRIERPKDPETGETCHTCPEYIVEDTPLLINIKGCGYPPEVDCDKYADTYYEFENSQDTFPCYYSRVNPWIVISEFKKEEEMSNIIFSILVPNIIFVLSLIVLVYWYCPYCQARCRKYEEHTDLGDPEDESEAEDYPNENPHQ